MLQESPSHPPWLPNGVLAHCPGGAGTMVIARKLGSGWCLRTQSLTCGMTLATRSSFWAPGGSDVKKGRLDYV